MYVDRVNRLLRDFDKDLFCRQGPDGVYRVIQKVRSYQVLDVDGQLIGFPDTQEHYVFSLTDTWSGNGKPVEWGMEPIFQKLRDISFERLDQRMKEMEDLHQKAEESKERALVSKSEDIAHETRDIYKKTFSDVLTHSMDMSKDSRRKYERKLKWQS